MCLDYSLRAERVEVVGPEEVGGGRRGERKGRLLKKEYQMYQNVLKENSASVDPCRRKVNEETQQG